MLRNAFLPTAAIVMVLNAWACAQEPALFDGAGGSDSVQADRADHAGDSWPHPTLSSDDHWAGDMVWIVMLGAFLPAAIMGPWIRRRVVGELPELHDREEQSALTASQHEPGHTRPTT